MHVISDSRTFPDPASHLSSTSLPVSCDLSYHNKGKNAKKKSYKRKNKSYPSTGELHCFIYSPTLIFPRIWHLASVNFRPWLQVFTHTDDGKIWLQALTWAPVTHSHFVIARISAHHETTANYFHITKHPGNLGVRPRPPSRWETVWVVRATSTLRRERETTSIFVVSAFFGGEIK